MCGIYGWLGKEVSCPEKIRQIGSEILRHRGPNDEGFEYGTDWGMGFRRLSILDLSVKGQQPMYSDDHRFCLVFNGEIYNYLELYDKLPKKGKELRGQADSEVLLNLLIIYGKESIGLLNGMFAFVFLDTLTGEFIIGRDRFGKKPFYYFLHKECLRFASELKAIINWPDSEFSINKQMLSEYLFSNMVSGSGCIFENCYKLEAGCFIEGNIHDVEKFQIAKYWSPKICIDNQVRDKEEYMLKVEEVLADAVKIRMRSDVPMGIFLSGGIDSSLVAAFSVQQQINGKNPLAFTVGFDEEKYDESSQAVLTAKKFGLEIKQIPLPQMKLEDIDILAKIYDEPFADASALPTYQLCKVASDYATVFLSGDGGDEAFAGYRSYVESLKYKNLLSMPEVLKKIPRVASKLFTNTSSLNRKLTKLGALGDYGKAFFDDFPFLTEYNSLFSKDILELRNKVYQLKLEKYWDSSMNLTTSQQLSDQKNYLTDDILVKVDRASMAHSVEVRSPLLDYRIFELANKIPRRLLLNNKKGKIILREIGKKYLPKAILGAPKKGFGVPLDDWFQNPKGNSFLQERLLDPTFALQDYVNASQVETLICMQKERKGQFGSLFWRLLMFDSWSKHYTSLQ